MQTNQLERSVIAFYSFSFFVLFLSEGRAVGLGLRGGTHLTKVLDEAVICVRGLHGRGKKRNEGLRNMRDTTQRQNGVDAKR